ncbi:hypothetical protein C5167_043583 [Papaver somniferum]|uniref:Uncharacterized protein n=1 Tax=Papaver somniferum TaxID=3469 RepID=A0A4Y7L9Z9_PAPSO|nr:hypothetical protein C5167_043583 [Papaver somniferum]
MVSALLYFLRASEKGRAGAGIAYGSLLLKGASGYVYGHNLLQNPVDHLVTGIRWGSIGSLESSNTIQVSILRYAKVPEAITEYNARSNPSKIMQKNVTVPDENPMELAKEKLKSP